MDTVKFKEYILRALFKYSITVVVEIYKSEHSVKLITLPNTNYYNTLRTKMDWSGNVR